MLTMSASIVEARGEHLGHPRVLGHADGAEQGLDLLVELLHRRREQRDAVADLGLAVERGGVARARLLRLGLRLRRGVDHRKERLLVRVALRRLPRLHDRGEVGAQRLGLTIERGPPGLPLVEGPSEGVEIHDHALG